mgnify:FL=1
MAISDIKTAISSAVSTALGVRCYTSVPSVIAELPCAYIQTGAGNHNINLPGNKSTRSFIVSLIFAKAEALEGIQAKLDTYLLPTGTGSMLVAIEGTSLSSYADFLNVDSDTGPIEIPFADVSYLGCRWTVKVMI